MGIFSDVVAPAVQATYADWSDFWYQRDPRGTATEANYPVSADSALRQSTVNACVGLISDMVGSLPLHVYRRLDNGGKERAIGHPAYTLLHRRPNQRQTPKEWLTMGAQHLLLRGNFYNEIGLDRRFAVGELRPLHPDRMTVTLLQSGRRGYRYRPTSGPERTFTQDEISHVMSPYSLDNGVTGCGVIEFAREAIGAAQAQEGFGARFYAQGAEGHLVFSTPNVLNDTTRAANEKVLRERMGGWRNAHQVMLMDGGIKPERVTTTSRDSQYIETQKFSVAKICQFFRTSPDMIGHNEGTSQWGTGIEQRVLGFLKFTLMPWLVAVQQRMNLDVLDDSELFAEFLLDAILAPDTVARFQAYGVAIMNGIMSENEVRIRENLNPVPGLDEPRRSANQDRGGNPAGSQPAPPAQQQTPPDEATPEDAAGAHARALVLEAAGRAVGREVVAIRKWQPRLAGDPGAWRRWVTSFYGKHAALLVRTLHLEEAVARRYGAAHCAELLAACSRSGAGAVLLEAWERQAPAALAELVLKGAHDSPLSNARRLSSDVLGG